VKILIVGGSGFVSGTLARRAVAEGHQVWVVTRGQRPLPGGVTGLAADRADRRVFRSVVEGAGVRWDLVVDSICYKPDDMRQDLVVFPGRASHFVFVSTDFVFDPARRILPQPEESEHYLDSGYGGEKRLCELELERSAPAGFPWTVFRCCHIYGPGSRLGCLPAHSRDPELLARIRRGEPLRLVGGGYFLQQPLFVEDLAALILSAAGSQRASNQIFNVAGPEIAESRRYYEEIAAVLGKGASFEELPVDRYRAEHPEHLSFLCHRIYRLDRLQEAGLRVPATPLRAGLEEHVKGVLAEESTAR
jgi:nucleoside-diphosphate-sugar epimerase